MLFTLNDATAEGQSKDQWSELCKQISCSLTCVDDSWLWGSVCRYLLHFTVYALARHISGYHASRFFARLSHVDLWFAWGELPQLYKQNRRRKVWVSGKWVIFNLLWVAALVLEDGVKQFPELVSCFHCYLSSLHLSVRWRYENINQAIFSSFY